MTAEGKGGDHHGKNENTACRYITDLVYCTAWFFSRLRSKSLSVPKALHKATSAEGGAFLPARVRRCRRQARDIERRDVNSPRRRMVSTGSQTA